MKTQIIVENVFVHQAEKRVYNQPALSDVEFVYNGEIVNVDKQELDEFLITGLSNIDFVINYDWDDDM